MAFGMIVETMVAILLAVTIGYCVVLNERLKRLHSDRDELRQMVADLVSATTLADAAIKELKSTAVEADLTLTARLEEAERFGVELAYHVNAGQSVLERTDRLNSIKITSAAVGRPSGTIVADIQKAMKKVKLPEGIILDYQGDAKNQGDAFASLGLAMGIGILLVYLIMVALYESVVYPFVVLFSIPVAMIGAILALALTMNSLTIFAILGLIMLLGLVSKNAILIVDFANHLKAKGMGVKEALVEAGRERLRPIMMTTLAMIFGMLPIAVASGAGAEVKNGMAWVIIGGLTSSMLLTLSFSSLIRS